MMRLSCRVQERFGFVLVRVGLSFMSVYTGVHVYVIIFWVRTHGRLDFLVGTVLTLLMCRLYDEIRC